LGLGGFPLTDFKSGLEGLFEAGEIAFYRSIDDARELISYFLKRDSERQKISQKGRARVLKDHTYFERSKMILKLVTRHFGI
jgi:spore maturation protein CgeB